MPVAQGALGQSVEQLLEEMKKAQADVQKLGKSNKGAKGPSFSEVLQAQGAQGAQQSQASPQVNGSQSLKEIFSQNKIKTSQPNELRVNSLAKAQRTHLASMLQKMVEGQDRMSHIINNAMSGKQFSPAELLAMQAQVYRYSQELELTSKVITKATEGVKQTMQTQV